MNITSSSLSRVYNITSEIRFAVKLIFPATSTSLTFKKINTPYKNKVLKIKIPKKNKEKTRDKKIQIEWGLFFIF
jgi:hypothetical protein